MVLVTVETSRSSHTLVTQPLIDTSKYFCPLLRRGLRHRFSRCKFSHKKNKSTKVPRRYCRFYLANRCRYGQDCNFRHSEPNDGWSKDSPLCPYFSANGICSFRRGTCKYLHGLTCNLCSRACLHPYNHTQRLQHHEDCLRRYNEKLKRNSAEQRSKDKVCGICLDIVLKKEPQTARRFGILQNCNHVFCLDCILRWRGTERSDIRTTKTCPECRVSSDFVIPSNNWVEDYDKENWIRGCKAAVYDRGIQATYASGVRIISQDSPRGYESQGWQDWRDSQQDYGGRSSRWSYDNRSSRINQWLNSSSPREWSYEGPVSSGRQWSYESPVSQTRQWSYAGRASRGGQDDREGLGLKFWVCLVIFIAYLGFRLFI